jgi:hypothetical protein
MHTSDLHVVLQSKYKRHKNRLSGCHILQKCGLRLSLRSHVHSFPAAGMSRALATWVTLTQVSWESRKSTLHGDKTTSVFYFCIAVCKFFGVQF